MATKPTLSNAEWATDTNFASGPASGTPTKVAPTTIKAQGWRPGDALGYVGAWFNYLLNQFYLWAAYLNDLHNSADFLNKNYTWTAVHTHTSALRVDNTVFATDVGLYLGDVRYVDSGGAYAVRTRVVSLPLAFVAGSTSATGFWKMATTAVASGGQAVGNVYFQLPSGVTITNISCWYTDAGTPGTFKVFRETFDVGTGAVTRTPIGSTGTSDSGSDIEVLTTGTVSHTVDNGGRYLIEVDSGAAGAIVHGIRVTFSDFGFLGNG